MFSRTREDWDFVLRFQSGADLPGWLQLIDELVERFGQTLSTLQITNEPNLMGMPDAGDGSTPNVREALVQGVLAAREAVRKYQATIAIGFNAVPDFLTAPSTDVAASSSSNSFWSDIKRLGGKEFVDALDHVGIDFYPDVFGPPIALTDLADAVEYVLRGFRTQCLAVAGIDDNVPLRINENGWPTGPDRSYERQAAVLETIIRTVHRLRAELHITHYELFGLRDADSSNDISFYQFGILRDDYSPKPAFAAYQRLIQELGRK
jgi:hypothetical protein